MWYVVVEIFKTVINEIKMSKKSKLFIEFNNTSQDIMANCQSLVKMLWFYSDAEPQDSK